MDNQTAIKLIQGIADSIKNNPNQFHFEINIIGTNVVNNAPGIGLAVTANGGGPGSNTVGFQSNLNASDISIVQKKADGEINSQINKLTDALDGIIVELKQSSVNESKINNLYKSILGNWVPNVITNTIGGILAACGIKFLGLI